MSQLRISRYEAEEGMLPPLCVCCGAPATQYQAASFPSLPPWMYYLALIVVWPAALVASLMRQRVRFALPVCRAHRFHWSWRRTALLCCFAALAWFLFIILDTAGNSGDNLVSSKVNTNLLILRSLTWLLGPAWLLLILVARIKAVWATEITENFVTLTGVHPRFREAYLAEHTPLKRENVISKRDVACQPSPQMEEARGSSKGTASRS